MKRLHWVILGLVFMATGLNFLDRQVLSITIIKIQKELNISDTQYGLINTAFLISYASMFTIGGRLTEIFGGKIGLAFSVGIWSVASILHGFTQGFFHLLGFRFLLGIGEGGCFPGAAKTVSQLFTLKNRAFANGIAIGGSAIGAVLAPPLTIWLANQYGWRWGFIVPGIVGVIWVLAWLTIPWKGLIIKEVIASEEDKPKKISMLQLLKDRRVTAFLIMRFLFDPVFYFIMFWIPKYLNEQRAISFDQIGELLWIPFFALGISNILGGWVSDRLIGFGFPVGKARKTVMGFAALFTTSALLIQSVPTAQWAVALMSLLMFAHGFWITNYITSIGDIFGDEATSTVVGMSGTCGALAGIMVNPFIGWVVQYHSYAPLWLVCGIVYPLAFLVFIVCIPKIKPHRLKINS